MAKGERPAGTTAPMGGQLGRLFLYYTWQAIKWLFWAAIAAYIIRKLYKKFKELQQPPPPPPPTPPPPTHTTNDTRIRSGCFSNGLHLRQSTGYSGSAPPLRLLLQLLPSASATHVGVAGETPGGCGERPAQPRVIVIESPDIRSVGRIIRRSSGYSSSTRRMLDVGLRPILHSHQ